MIARGERIPVKSRRDIERMRVAARHVAEVLLEPKLEPVSPPDPTPATRDLLALFREAHVASA